MSASKQQGPRHTPKQFFAQIDQWVDSFMQQDLSLLDDRTLWNQGLPIWRERGAYAWSTNLRISTSSGWFIYVLDWLVKWWTSHQEAAQDLVTALPGLFSAEVGPALWQMAQTLRELHLHDALSGTSSATALTLLQKNPAAQPFLEQLEHFLQRHGHRCPNELELLNPRWTEAPEQIVELTVSYLQADESSNPIEAEQRQRHHRAEAMASIEARLDPIRRAIFRIVLKRSQQATMIRDNSRYYMAKFIFPIRKLYAHLGQRWAERGWLEQPGDIFFLTIPEIEALVENGMALTSPQALQTRITNRRTAYEYWLTVVPPDAIGPDGKPIVEEAKDTHVLTGVPASSGKVRGRARIVQDVREAMKLTSGDILVTQATDPGWTPVFPLVSGIVLEIGGQLSHGAIVAREYAIPAVINVQGAMSNIHDGQIIVVDGTNGRVYLDEIASI
jgi:rifampicin phosphotransferase